MTIDFICLLVQDAIGMYEVMIVHIVSDLRPRGQIAGGIFRKIL